MQEVEELYHTDVELYFDFKVLADIYSINELPQDHLLTLDAASRIQVGPGHDLIILLLNSNGRTLQISRFCFGLFQFLCQIQQFVPGFLYHLTENICSETASPVDGLDDLFFVAFQLPLRGGMELLQIGHRTVCQLKFLLPLLLNELAPGGSLHPFKKPNNNLINDAVQFLAGVSGLTITVLRMADLVVAGVADAGFPLGLTLGTSAAAGGQHQLGTAVGTVDHSGE